jgi:hypothetical protein
MLGMPVMWNDFAQLISVGKTGKPMLDWAGLLEYFAAHPEESSLFNQAMVSKSARVVPSVLAVYDFSRFHLIADIGGGRGHLLKQILQRTPATSGVLFDLPHVVADGGDPTLERLRLQAGNFFTDLLPSSDGYVLMEVLHDWADQDAAKILASVRRAAPPAARLLIIEALVSDSPGRHSSKILDIAMLAVTGGRERTPSEYETLLAAAGFRIEQIIPTRSEYSVVEAVVA